MTRRDKERIINRLVAANGALSEAALIASSDRPVDMDLVADMRKTMRQVSSLISRMSGGAKLSVAELLGN